MIVQSWPYALKMTSCVFHPANAIRTGGATLTNAGQFVASPSACWRATITCAVWDEDSALAFEMLQGGLLGYAGAVLVPRLSLFRPYSPDGYMYPMENELGPDGRSLWDHTGFASEEVPSVFLDKGARLRATELRLSHPGAPPLRPGHYIGIGDRLHKVVNAWVISREIVGAPINLAFWGDEPFLWLDGDDTTWGDPNPTGTAGENILGVEIWPPLRSWVGAGEPLKLGRPVCKMRAVSSDTAELNMGLGYFGESTLEFIEVPW